MDAAQPPDAARDLGPAGYAFRQQVTVFHTGSTIPTPFSLSVTLDHAAMVDGGQALPDGRDLRLVYWPDGGSWAELDRFLDPGSGWNRSATTLWFPGQAVVSADGGPDPSYVLFWGNPAAAAPKEDPHQVFAFFDGFESGTLDAWTEPSGLGGNWSVDVEHAHHGRNALKSGPVNDAQRVLLARGVGFTNIYVDAFWYLSHPTGASVAQGVCATVDGGAISQYETALEGSSGWDLAKMLDGTWSRILDPPPGQAPPVGTWTRVGIGISGDRVRVVHDGAQVLPTSGDHDVGSQLNSGTASFRVWHINSSQGWWLDDVMVRRWLRREPRVEVGPVETVR